MAEGLRIDLAGFFPVDEETLSYLSDTGRDPERVKLVEAYAKAQGYWRPEMPDPVYTSTLELDLGSVVPSLAGPKRPQDADEDQAQFCKRSGRGARRRQIKIGPESAKDRAGESAESGL